MTRRAARATVRLVIEVNLSDRWSGNETVAEVERQAKEEARNTVAIVLGKGHNDLVRTPDYRLREATKIRLIGIESVHTFLESSEDK